MSKAAILFNGLRFPFAVVDAGFMWAKESSGSILAVYLVGRDEISEGYVFPSDLDDAEDLVSDNEASSDSESVLKSNRQMLANRAKTEGISFEAVVLRDASADQLSSAVAGCEYVFVSDSIDEISASENRRINIEKWSEKYEGSVRFVS